MRIREYPTYKIFAKYFGYRYIKHKLKFGFFKKYLTSFTVGILVRKQICFERLVEKCPPYSVSG